MKFIFLLFLVAAVYAGLQKDILAKRLPIDPLAKYEIGPVTSLLDCDLPPEFCHNKEPLDNYECWRWGQADLILKYCIRDACHGNCHRTKNNFGSFEDCISNAGRVCPTL
ncbi:uncharacterized protein LOC126884637 [Diabrotica virgifera virgifera]|uniref:Uncharacterized protein n=1 Tax=Diabrotica virgifera virgifera TaxID=50390 RepID=A0ABM5K8Z3_DIAVI|nr:uncharacterized protein LOC126884637 [Diabrotica virgifera virgifera]